MLKFLVLRHTRSHPHKNQPPSVAEVPDENDDWIFEESNNNNKTKPNKQSELSNSND